MGRPVKLSVVRSERKREAARSIRQRAHSRFREMAADHGDDLVGFALVTWDSKGAIFSTVNPGGALMKRIIPTAVHDALTQHASSDLAESEIKKMLWPK